MNISGGIMKSKLERGSEMLLIYSNANKRHSNFISILNKCSTPLAYRNRDRAGGHSRNVRKVCYLHHAHLNIKY